MVRKSDTINYVNTLNFFIINFLIPLKVEKSISDGLYFSRIFKIIIFSPVIIIAFIQIGLKVPMNRNLVFQLENKFFFLKLMYYFHLIKISLTPQLKVLQTIFSTSTSNHILPLQSVSFVK